MSPYFQSLSSVVTRTDLEQGNQVHSATSVPQSSNSKRQSLECEVIQDKPTSQGLNWLAASSKHTHPRS